MHNNNLKSPTLKSPRWKETSTKILVMFLIWVQNYNDSHVVPKGWRRIIRKLKFTEELAKFLEEKKVCFFVNVFPGVAAVMSQTP